MPTFITILNGYGEHAVLPAERIVCIEHLGKHHPQRSGYNALSEQTGCEPVMSIVSLDVGGGDLYSLPSQNTASEIEQAIQEARR